MRLQINLAARKLHVEFYQTNDTKLVILVWFSEALSRLSFMVGEFNCAVKDLESI